MQFTLYAQNAKWISDNKTDKHILSPHIMLNAFFLRTEEFHLYFSMPSLDGNKILGSIWMFWVEGPFPLPSLPPSLSSLSKHNLDSRTTFQTASWCYYVSRCDGFKLEFLRAHGHPEHIKQPTRSPTGRRRTKALVRSILEMACRNLLLCNICACLSHIWLIAGCA